MRVYVSLRHTVLKGCNQFTWCQMIFFKYFGTPTMNFLQFSLRWKRWKWWKSFRTNWDVFYREIKRLCGYNIGEWKNSCYEGGAGGGPKQHFLVLKIFSTRCRTLIKFFHFLTMFVFITNCAQLYFLNTHFFLHLSQSETST